LELDGLMMQPRRLSSQLETAARSLGGFVGRVSSRDATTSSLQPVFASGASETKDGTLKQARHQASDSSSSGSLAAELARASATAVCAACDTHLSAEMSDGSPDSSPQQVLTNQQPTHDLSSLDGHSLLMVTSAAGGLHVGTISGARIRATIRNQFSEVIEEDGAPAQAVKSK
jgi:hypothetical protein